MDEVRDRQLELLSKFDEFCLQNDIQYYAFAGTLLGVVRHKGFIPWDNDIDVAVSREDYTRMQTILKDEGANPYFRFLCNENYPEYLWQHGRISAKGTFMKTAKGYSKLGLSIDIFPLDNQGNNYEEALSNLKKIKECVQLRIMSYDYKYKTMHYPKKTSFFDKCVLGFKFYVLRNNTEAYWVHRHIELAKKFINEPTDSKYYGCNSNDKYTVVCERKWYDSAIRLPFENTSIPVPVGYKEILARYYGDFMQLPPKNKQVGAKEMCIFVED